MTDISLPAAVGAGLLSFLSPCVLPLAPPYLCYLAGTSMEALVDQCLADYDTSGWTDPAWINP